MSKCLLCARRRGTRDCPALRTQICSLCCGTKRRRTVDCPEDCRFLAIGRDYHAARIGLPEAIVELRKASPDYLHNLELAILNVRQTRFRDLLDREAKEALENVLKTIEAAERKIIYEYRSLDPRIQITTDSIKSVMGLHHDRKKGLRRASSEEIKACLLASITAARSFIRQNPDSVAYLDLITQYSTGSLMTELPGRATLVDDETLDYESEPKGLIQLP